jgi:uncharacterized protein YbbK (DUF523 family)
MVILISACLCGIDCKYDGGSNRHPLFVEMLRAGKVIPVCPEQLGGLTTPREPAEICGGAGEQVLSGQARVINRLGCDVSAAFLRGAEQTLKIAQAVNPSLIILKSRSPSCGVGRVYDGSFSSRFKSGNGVTAALLKAHGFDIIDDEAYLKQEIKN